MLPLLIVFCIFCAFRSTFLCLLWRCSFQISSLQYVIACFWQFWGGSYVPISSFSLPRGSFCCQSVFMSSESFFWSVFMSSETFKKVDCIDINGYKILICSSWRTRRTLSINPEQMKWEGIKVHKKNMSCECALNFDQWKTFAENCKPMRVWLWFVYKFT